MVSKRPTAAATIVFVPTPSVELTSTGASIWRSAAASYNPPNVPTPDSTCGP